MAWRFPQGRRAVGDGAGAGVFRSCCGSVEFEGVVYTCGGQESDSDFDVSCTGEATKNLEAVSHMQASDTTTLA